MNASGKTITFAPVAAPLQSAEWPSRRTRRVEGHRAGLHDGHVHGFCVSGLHIALATETSCIRQAIGDDDRQHPDGRSSEGPHTCFLQSFWYRKLYPSIGHHPASAISHPWPPARRGCVERHADDLQYEHECPRETGKSDAVGPAFAESLAMATTAEDPRRSSAPTKRQRLAVLPNRVVGNWAVPGRQRKCGRWQVAATRSMPPASAACARRAAACSRSPPRPSPRRTENRDGHDRKCASLLLEPTCNAIVDARNGDHETCEEHGRRE